jgi:succinate dehydrogenase / fumarate reductase membrane anchor subunit
MRIFAGQRAFVLQRISALVLLASVTAIALRLAIGPQVTFAQWRTWVAQPLAASVLLLVAAALFMHAWVGIRDVVLDYVQPLALRLTVMIILAAGLSMLAAWTGFIVVTRAL